MSLREDAKKIYSSSLATMEPRGTIFNYLKKNQIIPLNYKNIYPIAFGKASISMMSGFLDYLTKDFSDISIKGKPIAVSYTHLRAHET